MPGAPKRAPASSAGAHCFPIYNFYFHINKWANLEFCTKARIRSYYKLALLFLVDHIIQFYFCAYSQIYSFIVHISCLYSHKRDIIWLVGRDKQPCVHHSCVLISKKKISVNLKGMSLCGITPDSCANEFCGQGGILQLCIVLFGYSSSYTFIIFLRNFRLYTWCLYSEVQISLWNVVG